MRILSEPLQYHCPKCRTEYGVYGMGFRAFYCKKCKYLCEMYIPSTAEEDNPSSRDGFY